MSKRVKVVGGVKEQCEKGEGKSKKEAEQNAAKEALEKEQKRKIK